MTGAMPTLDESYAICRAIAKREAKNFYYSFVALPPARRNAICAIYAYMRKADDLSDDESVSHAERRRNLDEWLAAWHEASRCGASSDPVFIAVRDAVQRFNIPLSLLDELVAGTTMDLDVASGSAPDTYATFDELYRYCYLVASVVGLVCIRIFGYSDPRAEKLAEETGVAFQLTNILRDVAEDAARNRVYLPLQDLAVHNVSLEATRASHAWDRANSEGACSSGRNCAAGRKFLSIRGRLAAADRSREPASVVGAGRYLSFSA